MSKQSRRNNIAGGGFNPAQTSTLVEEFGRSEVYLTEPLVVDQQSPGSRDPIKITGPSALFITPDEGGNPQTSPNVDNWSRRAFIVDDVTTETSEMELFRAYCSLRDDEGGTGAVTLWCTLGAEIEFYQVFYEITDPAALCPFDGGTQPWSTWEATSPGALGPQEIDGRWFRNNLRYDTNRGIAQLATEWFSYIETPDTANSNIVAVLSVEDFVALQPDPDPASQGGRR